MANATVVAGFASESHNAVAQAVDRWLRSQSDADRKRPPEPWFEFGGGWRGLEIRYQACCEHDQTFRDAITRNPNADQYLEEKQLFGFFTTGLAATESFFYALYAFGWMLNRGKAGAFALIAGRGEEVTPEKTRDAFRKRYGTSDPLVIALDSVLNDPSWKEWKNIRNVLAHRAAPLRIFHFSGSMGGPAGPKPEPVRQESRLKELGTLDESTTRTRREWLEATLERLLKAAELFATKHVP